jgi:hypothetical protein
VEVIKMIKNARIICKIGNIEFFTRDIIVNDKKIIFTHDENYAIDYDENEEKACKRIFNFYY